MPYLSFYRRGMHHLDLELGEARFSLGSEDATLYLPIEGLAPRQFEIVREGDAYRLNDLSGKGTQVGTELVDTVLLRGETVIHAGGFAIKFAKELDEGYDDDAPATMVDPFLPQPLPRELWITAQRKSGGPLVQATLHSGRSELTIGSDDSCDLKLDGAHVSGRHLRLTREEGRLHVQDLGSTNGTWLGAYRVESGWLPLSLRLRAGDWEIWAAGRGAARAQSEAAKAGGLLTCDPKVLSVIAQADLVAKLDVPVLIGGETGTGKELLAALIHERSRRATAPLAKVNCALVLPPGQLAAQLFGHEREAYTGAETDKPGTVRAADGGTVHLDEMGDLPADVQGGLLRAIGEGEINPLGAPRAEKVDVRWICSTHVDLARAVAEGRFREDLFYRINPIELTMPPLRERPGDILLLFEHFLQRDSKGQKFLVSEGARRKLLDHAWPGNVRELLGVVQRALIFATENVIGPEHVVFKPREGQGAAKPTAQPDNLDELTLEQAELVLVRRALQRCGGNQTAAAKQLGISRERLRRKLGGGGALGGEGGAGDD